MKPNNKKAWDGKSRGGAFGHHFFVFLIRIFGVRAAYVFLSLVAIYFIPFARKATIAIWHYNRNILRYGRLKSMWKLYVHYYTFGQTLIDKIAINNGLSNKYKFDFENYENFLEKLDVGSVVMLGAHVGNWEIGSKFFDSYASRLNIVMYDAEYKKIKDIVNAGVIPYNIIPINEGSIESIIKIKNCLDRGEYVCFQGDRYVEGGNKFEAEFMGEKAYFPTGPFLVASKFKTSVVLYFSTRERGMRYKFHFRILEGGMSKEELFREYIEELGNIVKQYPQQWFNFYEVWHKE